MATIFETEGATLIDIRAEALINQAFLRVIRTGPRQQIAVMTLPPETEIGDQVRPQTDQLFVVVEGVGEARLGDLELAIQAGDLLPVDAGTRYDIVNRATLPLRLIAVLTPPAYAPGTAVDTLETHEARPPERWHPFP